MTKPLFAASRRAPAESALFGRRAVGVFVRCALDRLREMFGRLRALYGNAAAENEAGHAVDACFLGSIGLSGHAFHVVPTREARAYALGIEAACGRRLDQRVAVREIADASGTRVHLVEGVRAGTLAVAYDASVVGRADPPLVRDIDELRFRRATHGLRK